MKALTNHPDRAFRGSSAAGACLAVFAVLGTPLGCSSIADDGSSTGARGGSDFPSDGGAGGASGADGSGGRSLGGNGDDGSGFGRADFRFGINLGHPNPDFDDAEMSDLGARVGVASIRLKYPEYHFATWGPNIEVGDAEHYASLEMSDHVAFLIGMTAEHSSAPAGLPDWQRDEYIPKNLYEPIFAEDGEVNPENYFARYVADTMRTYGNFVKYWEIWNEPDWVSDWQVTVDWETRPPSKEDLVRFHGSIFDYVRMLRIASVVRDRVAPETYVLTGGLGYPSFLSALLRYTDNPDDGKVTEEFPATGAAYFDVLSIHHYPHLVESGNSDAGLRSLVAARDDFLAELTKVGATDKGWMLTETGASHTLVSGTASGPEYARNYAQKALIWAKAEGFLGVDWFTLSDGATASDPFAQMGLFESVASLTETAAAVPTDTGRAYHTTSDALSGARLDVAKTEALALPTEVIGYVFEKDGAAIYALWTTADAGEDAAREVTLPLSGTIDVRGWGIEDEEGAPTSTNGSLALTVTSSPTFVVVR